MTVAGQSAVTYTWDSANRLTGITQGSSVVGLVYDNANRRTTLTLPNGVTVAYTYDSDSRVTGITYTAGSTQLGNLTYSYDAAGRRTAVGGSLAAVNLPAAVSGNTFNVDNGMTGFNGSTLGYDANGNLTSDGTNTYTWDARHHLTAISGGATASFVYDAFGRRMSKTMGGNVTQFLYDGLNPVQELAAGNPPASVTANLLTGLNLDEYFTRTASGATSTLLADAVGSTIGLVGSGGTIGTSYTYQPFGATTVSGGNSNPYQFTGRENDATGLYFYRARYYSPTFQRFVAQDPIGFAGGDPSLYGYAFNEPTTLRDPSGRLIPEADAGAALAGALIGGVVSAATAIGNHCSIGQIAAATAVGAVVGATTGVKLSNFISTTVVGGVVGGLGALGSDLVTGQPITSSDIVGGVVAGATGGFVGYGAGSVTDEVGGAIFGGMASGVVEGLAPGGGAAPQPCGGGC